MIKKYGYLLTLLLSINSASYGFLKPFQCLGSFAATKCLKQTRNHFTAHAAQISDMKCNTIINYGDGTIVCDGKVINKPDNASPQSITIINGHIILPETKSLNPVSLTTQAPFILDVKNLISGNISLGTHNSNQLIINGTASSYDKEALNKMGFTTTENDSSNTKVISIATYDNSPTQNPWGWIGNTTYFSNSNSINLNILVPAACNLFLIKSNNGGINLTTPGTQASLKATTLNGSINAENIYGTTVCQTTNGSINLKNIYGSTQAYSSNGAVRLENMHNQINAQTSNGQITCNWKQLPEYPTHNVLQTSNGKITLSVPKKDVTIEASTSNGNITLNNKNYGTYLSQYFGSGKHSIKAHTSNSKIDISAFYFI